MIALRALCLSGLIATAIVSSAHAGAVGREQDVGDLRLGQRVLVDDGTCPAGQIKEVRGTKMTQTGVARTAACVPRFGPKTR
jgi:nucleoside phosphorylase